MGTFECTFGEGLQFAGEFGEIHLQSMRTGNRHRAGACLTKKYQFLKNNHQEFAAQSTGSFSIASRHNKNKNQTKKPAVLLVEDNDLIRKININFLESFGCAVTAARDGKEAFDFLQEKFDLILLDIGLPDISGTEICKQIRANSINKNTPVIFLTAFGEGLKDKCIAAGCNDFAVKPLAIEKLHKLVCKWLLQSDSGINEEKNSNGYKI